MKFRFACLAALLALSSTAFAAPPQYINADQSTANLIDKATVAALLQDVVTPQLTKMYSPKKWGFATEVEGGFTSGKTCVVTARVMLMPVAGKALLFRPSHKATTFDALPNATQAQCSDLAKAKLKEAVQALAFGLVKS
jgi:hypothetical protein